MLITPEITYSKYMYTLICKASYLIKSKILSTLEPSAINARVVLDSIWCDLDFAAILLKKWYLVLYPLS
jgi:hypothetical protein